MGNKELVVGAKEEREIVIEGFRFKERGFPRSKIIF